MAEIIKKPKPLGVRAREVARRLLRHENAVLVGILVVIIAVLAGVSGGYTVSLANVRNVLIQSTMRGIAALGQGFVLLTGNFDLSVGGLATMTSLLGAALLTENLKRSLLGHPVAIGLAILLMLLAGLGIGAANGLSVSRLRMPALIVTLAMWQITNGIAFQIGKAQTVAGLPQSMAVFGQGEVAGVPVPVIIFIIVAVIAYFFLNYTTFGRSIYATGGSPASAYLSGIRVPNIQLAAFLICGFTSALASLTFLSRAMSASTQHVLGLELDSIASCVIGGISLFGGRGTIIGIVLGVMIIGVIGNGMNVSGLPAPVQDVIRGAIIVIAVAIDNWRRR